MTDDTLSKYIHAFRNLHRNQNAMLGGAPHKPILLLAMLDGIERGEITNDQVALTPELTAAFRDYWRVLVKGSGWQERIVLPFRHMVKEGFWELKKNGQPIAVDVLNRSPSIRLLTTETDGAELASDLWELLQIRSARHTLRTVLLQAYFGVGMADVRSELHPDPMNYEAERLKAEALGRFRARHAREEHDETGYYVRHALFPKVVKSLYNYSCAVCGLSVRADSGGSLVDAAHIMPFGLFHNDDPRNGLALCKNHHWGFDAGWFTATADYKILVSPRLQSALTYVSAGAALLIPAQTEYAPAVEALDWHRQNVYRR